MWNGHQNITISNFVLIWSTKCIKIGQGGSFAKLRTILLHEIEVSHWQLYVRLSVYIFRVGHRPNAWGNYLLLVLKIKFLGPLVHNRMVACLVFFYKLTLLVQNKCLIEIFVPKPLKNLKICWKSVLYSWYWFDFRASEILTWNFISEQVL